MKTQKLILIVASACILAIFVSGPAYAQREPMEIAQEFCDEIQDAAEDTNQELDEATSDLADCPVEFEDCQEGIFAKQPAECIRDFNQCVDRAFEDAGQACNAYLRKFQDAYDDALRRARRSGPRVERRVQTLLANRLRQECFKEAVEISIRCSQRLSSVVED